MYSFFFKQIFFSRPTPSRLTMARLPSIRFVFPRVRHGVPCAVEFAMRVNIAIIIIIIIGQFINMKNIIRSVMIFDRPSSLLLYTYNTLYHYFVTYMYDHMSFFFFAHCIELSSHHITISSVFAQQEEYNIIYIYIGIRLIQCLPDNVCCRFPGRARALTRSL